MSALLSIEAACRKITKRNRKGEIRPVTRNFFLKHIYPLINKVEIGDRKYIEESEIELFLIKSRDMTVDVRNKSPEVRKIFNRKREKDFEWLYDRTKPIPKRKKEIA